MGRRGALGQPPAAWRERRREVILWCTVHHSPPLETQRLRKPLFYWCFGYRWLLGQRRNRNKTKQKILHPALLRGREWCGHHLPMSSLLHLWVARLRASCTCAYRQVWRGPGRAPRRCLVEGCCGCTGAGAAAEGRPRRRAGWGAAAGVEAAGFLRRMMCLIASVCFCAAENCWAKLSTVSELHLLLLLHVSETQPEMALLDH